MAGTPAEHASKCLEGLNIRAEHDAPLGALTWYGVGGRADVLAHPSSTAQLSELINRCQSDGVPLYVLGSGANLLVRDAGVRGIVVRLDDPAFAHVEVDGAAVTAGAGADLFKLVMQTAKAGLAGLEDVAGIPASVGGAVRMNAGGAYGDIGSAVKRVRVMAASGQVYHRDRDDLKFGYRKVNIAAPLILGVEFDLAEDDPDELMRRVKEIFLYKKTTQPMGDRSAGCAFKNPPAEDAPVIDGRTAAAGMLIDRAGLKGFRHGRAYVSDVHANFIGVDRGEGEGGADDVIAVLDHVQATVADRFGVQLDREVVVWP